MASQDALSIMLGAPGGEGAMPAEPGADDSYLQAFEGAAAAAMEAWEAGDVAMFASNLKDAIEICVEHKETGGDLPIGGGEELLPGPGAGY